MKVSLGIELLLLRAVATANRLLPQSVRLSVLRLPIASNLIRKALNLAAPKGLAEVTVSAGVLEGARLLLDLKKEKYYWLGSYEPMLQKAILAFVKPGMVVYDLGANIGYISLIFARVVGATGKVFAFEPLPGNAERLGANVLLNNADHVVHLVPIAASDEKGRARFLVHDSFAMGKLKDIHGRNTTYLREIDVPTARLDDFVFQDRNPPPDVVKMDIEGGGEKAIPGLERILADCRPLCLLELHGLDERRTAWSALRRHGYTVCRMASGYPKIENESELEWKEYIVALP